MNTEKENEEVKKEERRPTIRQTLTMIASWEKDFKTSCVQYYSIVVLVIVWEIVSIN